MKRIILRLALLNLLRNSLLPVSLFILLESSYIHSFFPKRPSRTILHHETSVCDEHNEAQGVQGRQEKRMTVYLDIEGNKQGMSTIQYSAPYIPHN